MCGTSRASTVLRLCRSHVYLIANWRMIGRSLATRSRAAGATHTLEYQDRCGIRTVGRYIVDIHQTLEVMKKTAIRARVSSSANIRSKETARLLSGLGVVVEDDAAQVGWVGLVEAIESLRVDLTFLAVASRVDQQAPLRVRFRVEPVELALQVGVTRSRKGAAGVKWHVLTLGGERSREVGATQTLKLRLTPVLFDEKGNELPRGEQMISDLDTGPGMADAPTYERE